MTREEILAMPAGPELDVLVSRTLGLPETYVVPPGEQGDGQECVISRSRDIAAAWELVEKFAYHEARGGKGKVWRWYLESPAWDRRAFGEAEAATAPHAISLAALLAALPGQALTQPLPLL